MDEMNGKGREVIEGTPWPFPSLLGPLNICLTVASSGSLSWPIPYPFAGDRPSRSFLSPWTSSSPAIELSLYKNWLFISLWPLQYFHLHEDKQWLISLYLYPGVKQTIEKDMPNVVGSCSPQYATCCKSTQSGEPRPGLCRKSWPRVPISLPSMQSRFPQSLFAWPDCKHHSCSDPHPLLLLVPA